jgi:hypothetical protein
MSSGVHNLVEVGIKLNKPIAGPTNSKQNVLWQTDKYAAGLTSSQCFGVVLNFALNFMMR